MGLLFKEYVKPGCLLGIWETSEDFITLYSGLSLSEDEIRTLNSFGNYSRKLEWLTVRSLLNDLLGRKVKIHYNGKRKPFLDDGRFNISISHSNRLTSVLMSREHRVGIDMEHMTGKITGLSDKFLSPKEQSAVSKDKAKYHIYLYWCAKEALYKICDMQKLNFKKDILIDPFEPRDNGTLTGRVINSSVNEEFQLEYFRYGDYSVVWCCK